jgi:serine/threonine-protein kinase
VFRSAAAALDAYGGAWVAMRDQACRAHEPRPVAEARVRCLQARLDETRALVDLLEHADPDLVDHATDAANTLTPLEGCADTQALATLAPAPADHLRVEGIQRRVAAAEAQLAAGRPAAALALAEPASAEAKQLGWRPLEAEAGYTLGRAYEAAARYPEAAAVLEGALWAAEAGRADELKAEIAMFSAAVLSRWLYRVDEAHARERQADAALERLGPRPLLRASFENYLGMSALHEQRLAKAEKHLGRALALLEHVDDLRRARTQVNLAEVLIEEERLDDAEAAVRGALPLLQQRLGVHTDVAAALERLAEILVDRGRYGDALPPAERALTIRERLLGPANPRVAYALSALGNALRGLGRHAEAERHHRRAVELQAALGDSIELALALDELGSDLQAAGRLDDAWAAFARAAAIRERKLPPEDADRGVSLFHLGDVLWRQKRAAEAEAKLRAALAICDRALGDSSVVASVLARLGEVELALGEAAAVPHLQRAVSMRAAHPHDPSELAEARALLARAEHK